MTTRAPAVLKRGWRGPLLSAGMDPQVQPFSLFCKHHIVFMNFRNVAQWWTLCFFIVHYCLHCSFSLPNIVFLFGQLYWFLCHSRSVFGIWGGRIWLKYDFLARIFPGVPLKAGIICRPRLESLWWINKSPLLRNICKNYGSRKVFLKGFASLCKLSLYKVSV